MRDRTAACKRRDRPVEPSQTVIITATADPVILLEVIGIDAYVKESLDDLHLLHREHEQP